MWEEYLTLVVMVITVLCTVSEAAEYCDKETFEANCDSDQIILMQHAKYGRMSAGRCINGEGQMGCHHDVIQKLHAMCSGRQTCQFEVSDIGKEREPCNKDYTSYLEAVYKCEDLAAGDPSPCSQGSQLGGHQILLTSSSGLLPSLTYSSHVGVHQCPWTIQAKQGQRVQLNISVFNASRGKSEDGGSGGVCHYSVMLREMDSHTWHRKEVCGYSWGQTHMYTSRKSRLQVFNNAATSTTPSGGNLANAPTYVIHYQVIGCADVIGPSFSSVIRTGNDLEVTCTETKVTWFLTCKGNKWIGEIGNCTRSPIPRADSVTGSDIPYPQGLIAAVILGLVLGVLIGFTSLGIYVIHRRRKRQLGQSYPQEPVPLHYDVGKEPQYGEVPLYQESGSSSTYYADNNQPPYRGQNLKLSHVCDQPPPAPPLQESSSGGGGGVVVGVVGGRGANKMMLHGDQQLQQHPSFVQLGGRRDLL